MPGPNRDAFTIRRNFESQDVRYRTDRYFAGGHVIGTLCWKCGHWMYSKHDGIYCPWCGWNPQHDTAKIREQIAATPS